VEEDKDIVQEQADAAGQGESQPKADEDVCYPETEGGASCSKMPPVEFSGFIVSLAQAALMQLGDIPDPTTGQPARNVDQARYSIDLIDMLSQKTQGNLTEEEQTLIQRVLSDLKLRFVRSA
jgi:hypothetical protein